MRGLLRRGFIIHCHNERLVGVEASADQVVEQIEDLQQSDEPVKILQPSSVEVGGEPIVVPVSGCDLVDGGNKKSAEIATGGD